MKKIISLFLSTALLFNILMVNSVVATATESPKISVGSLQCSAGDTINVPVEIKNNSGITSFRFTIDYDEAIFELTNVTFGSAAEEFSTGTSQYYTSPYSISGYNSVENVNSNGELAILTFSVNSNTEYGNYDICISYDADDVFNLNFENVHFDTEDGSITVGTCNHSGGQWEYIKNVTCTEDGIRVKNCENCGEEYIRETVEATGHNFNSTITAEPTCTTDGLMTYTCVECGLTYTSAIDKLRHNVITDNAVAATCTVDGKTEGSHCSICNQVFVPQQSIPAEHKWNNGIITKRATCIDNGVKTFTCTVCGETKTEPIIAQGHNYTEKVIAPTCTNIGYTEHTCIVCNDSYKDNYYPAIEHKAISISAVAPTCTSAGLTEGSKCSVCGEIIAEQETIAKVAHTTKTTVTKATLSKDGKNETKCTVCGAATSTTTIAYPKTITLSATSYTYDSKAKKPSVTVKGSDGKTIASSNYTVSYASGRKIVGKYAVKITFKGNYSGTKTLYFTIVPKATSISSVTAASKAFTVKWKKQVSQTTGYEIQYATDSKFTKNKKTVTVSKNSTTSKKISKLSAKKKYYVRIRTYKTVKVNGKSTKIYSGWSKVKTVTTKK